MKWMRNLINALLSPRLLILSTRFAVHWSICMLRGLFIEISNQKIFLGILRPYSLQTSVGHAMHLATVVQQCVEPSIIYHQKCAKIIPKFSTTTQSIFGPWVYSLTNSHTASHRSKPKMFAKRSKRSGMCNSISLTTSRPSLKTSYVGVFAQSQETASLSTKCSCTHGSKCALPPSTTQI